MRQGGTCSQMNQGGPEGHPPATFGSWYRPKPSDTLVIFREANLHLDFRVRINLASIFAISPGLPALPPAPVRKPAQDLLKLRNFGSGDLV
jgi:hypothetical protein